MNFPTVDEEYVGDNVRIRIAYDENASSPREWDNLTVIRGWHRRDDEGRCGACGGSGKVRVR